MESPFLFTVCQVGAEKALKEELARDYPALRFAFSRPGFVTFKAQEGAFSADFELRSIFARAYGLSLGRKVTDVEEAGRVHSVLTILNEVQALAHSEGRPLKLHVFERDLYAPGEEAQGYIPGLKAGALERAIREKAPAGLLADESDADLGDSVLDLVWVDENEWWVGFHRHTSAHAPVPGGRWKIVLPPEAPSRAYLKLEEAIRWSKAPLHAGDLAVEIGSAPGGASYALLQRGVNVIGIDPGAMDPVVLNFHELSGGHARFSHEARSVTTVRREELPRSVQWLLVDMNVGPDTAIYPVERLAVRMQDSLLGVILTLKMNEWAFAKHLPNWLERIRKMGMSRVRARQLANNRQEICVVGFTRMGVASLKLVP